MDKALTTDAVLPGPRNRVGTDDLIPGARDERTLAKKRGRSAAKAAFTKCMNSTEQLIYNSSGYNAEEVRESISRFEDCMHKFKSSHESYHAELTFVEDLEESQIYFEQVQRLFSEKCFEFQNFIENCELSRRANIDDEITPEDSASNIDLKSKSKLSSTASSKNSKSSSSASTCRLRATAKRAALEARAASLKSLHELQQEEISLKQRREQLEISSQIAEAEAEERVFSEAEASQLGQPSRGSRVEFSAPFTGQPFQLFPPKPEVIKTKDSELPRASSRDKDKNFILTLGTVMMTNDTRIFIRECRAEQT